MEKQKKQTTEKQKDLFFKEQFLQSSDYKNRKDLLTALLKDDTTYTKKEVEQIIKNYLKEMI